MILLHSILLVLFLPSLLHAGNVFSESSIINWEECDTSRCYCASDVDNKMTERTTKVDKANPLTVDLDKVICNVGMQIRYFNEKLVLIEMQVVGKSVTADSAELTFYQGTTKMFGCKFEGGKVTFDESDYKDPATIRKFRFELFEDQSHLKDGNVYCAIKIGHAVNFKNFLAETARLNGETDPMIKLKAGAIAEDYDGEGLKKDYLTSKTSRLCDPYSFKDLERSSKFHVKPLGNRHKFINCDVYKSYTMKYIKDNDPVEYSAQKLVCKKSATKYELHLYDDNSPPSGTLLVNPEKYTFYCAKDFQEICSKPASPCTADCPQYTAGGPGTAATLTCANRKWIVDGEFVVLDADPVCEQDVRHPEGAAFHVGDDGSKPGEACFTNYDCKLKSNLDYPDCPDASVCELKFDGGVMRCNNTAMEMRIHDYETNTDQNITNAAYTCDGGSGVWKNASGGTIPSYARVRCFLEAPVQPEVAAADLTDGAIYGIIGSCAAVFMIATIVAYCFVLRYVRRRHDIRLATKKGFQKLPKKQKIASIKEDYAKILAKPTVKNIIDGLRLIDLLLETETAYSECWEDAFKFLRLFLGSMMDLDLSIIHLAGRYLYLKARAIIDKHGWKVPRNQNKKQKDPANQLIRVVAIRLLGFCFIDRAADVEACKLVETGFRTLGWDMARQYPHCGLLWSLLQPSHPLKAKNRAKPTLIAGLKHDIFMEFLIGLAVDDKGEKPAATIAEFGSPAAQAAYALGRLANLTFHNDYAQSMIKKKTEKEGGDVARHYFLGMIDAFSKNPVYALTETLKLWPDVNKDMLPRMRAVMTEKAMDAASRYLLSVVVATGNHLEAKRMETAFLPSPAESNLEAIEKEQRDFEEVLEKVNMEQLRGWFAARTDRADLKRAPVYCKARCAQVDGGSQTPGSAAATPPTGSGSASSAAAASPADAAAAPQPATAAAAPEPVAAQANP